MAWISILSQYTVSTPVSTPCRCRRWCRRGANKMASGAARLSTRFSAPRGHPWITLADPSPPHQHLYCRLHSPTSELECTSEVFSGAPTALPLSFFAGCAAPILLQATLRAVEQLRRASSGRRARRRGEEGGARAVGACGERRATSGERGVDAGDGRRRMKTYPAIEETHPRAAGVRGPVTTRC